MNNSQQNTNDIRLILIGKIHEHEAVDPVNLVLVKEKIRKTAVFKVPIIIDKHTFIVLDGHHRLQSCKELGLQKIPCILVDYLRDKTIKVFSRRPEISINKQRVIEMGLSDNVFPHKTTKHHIPKRIKNLCIPLFDLV